MLGQLSDDLAELRYPAEFSVTIRGTRYADGRKVKTVKTEHVRAIDGYSARLLALERTDLGEPGLEVTRVELAPEPDLGGRMVAPTPGSVVLANLRHQPDCKFIGWELAHVSTGSGAVTLYLTTGKTLVLHERETNPLTGQFSPGGCCPFTAVADLKHHLRHTSAAREIYAQAGIGYTQVLP